MLTQAFTFCNLVNAPEGSQPDGLRVNLDTRCGVHAKEYQMTSIKTRAACAVGMAAGQITGTPAPTGNYQYSVTLTATPN